MNRTFWVSGLMLVSLCGCSSMNNTERGALGGGAVRAGLGALAGAATGHAGAGAAIGGGAGALVGGLLGNDQDRIEKRQAQAAAAYAASHPQVALTDVVQMAQQHLSDDLILNQIRTTNSYYSLTAADITYLREQGVSERVILEMQSRRGPVMVRPRSVVVVEQPAPPVAIGVGIGYGRRGW